MKRLSRIQRRLIRSAVEIETAEPGAITYQHTVFCQTGLPYRSPGAEVREWGRRQGNIALQVSAGAALHPESGEWVPLPLPFGPKPSNGSELAAFEFGHLDRPLCRPCRSSRRADSVLALGRPTALTVFCREKRHAPVVARPGLRYLSSPSTGLEPAQHALSSAYCSRSD